MKKIIALLLCCMVLFVACKEEKFEGYQGKHYILTFAPENDYTPTQEQTDKEVEIITSRAALYSAAAKVTVNNKQISVDIPKDSTNWFLGEKLLTEKLAKNARLLFVEGNAEESSLNKENPEKIILENEDVETISPVEINGKDGDTQYVLSFVFDEEGKKKFADSTTELAKNNGKISIWLDDVILAVFTVNTPLLDGKTYVTGNFTAETVMGIVTEINTGTLPYALKVVK
ncbi:MAG: hypothetical protein LBM93_10560 [Oscillospiraceae bacterium]|nr:hypothetical protein [Oscillospiraceae bacterium]